MADPKTPQATPPADSDKPMWYAAAGLGVMALLAPVLGPIALLLGIVAVALGFLFGGGSLFGLGGSGNTGVGGPGGAGNRLGADISPGGPDAPGQRLPPSPNANGPGTPPGGGRAPGGAGDGNGAGGGVGAGGGGGGGTGTTDSAPTLQDHLNGLPFTAQLLGLLGGIGTAGFALERAFVRDPLTRPLENWARGVRQGKPVRSTFKLPLDMVRGTYTTVHNKAVAVGRLFGADWQYRTEEGNYQQGRTRTTGWAVDQAVRAFNEVGLEPGRPMTETATRAYNEVLRGLESQRGWFRHGEGWRLLNGASTEHLHNVARTFGLHHEMHTAPLAERQAFIERLLRIERTLDTVVKESGLKGEDATKMRTSLRNELAKMCQTPEGCAAVDAACKDTAALRYAQAQCEAGRAGGLGEALEHAQRTTQTQRGGRPAAVPTPPSPTPTPVEPAAAPGSRAGTTHTAVVSATGASSSVTVVDSGATPPRPATPQTTGTGAAPVVVSAAGQPSPVNAGAAPSTNTTTVHAPTAGETHIVTRPANGAGVSVAVVNTGAGASRPAAHTVAATAVGVPRIVVSPFGPAITLPTDLVGPGVGTPLGPVQTVTGHAGPAAPVEAPRVVTPEGGTPTERITVSRGVDAPAQPAATVRTGVVDTVFADQANAPGRPNTQVIDAAFTDPPATRLARIRANLAAFARPGAAVGHVGLAGLGVVSGTGRVLHGNSALERGIGTVEASSSVATVFRVLGSQSAVVRGYSHALPPAMLAGGLYDLFAPGKSDAQRMRGAANATIGGGFTVAGARQGAVLLARYSKAPIVRAVSKTILRKVGLSTGGRVAARFAGPVGIALLVTDGFCYGTQLLNWMGAPVDARDDLFTAIEKMNIAVANLTQSDKDLTKPRPSDSFLMQADMLPVTPGYYSRLGFVIERFKEKGLIDSSIEGWDKPENLKKTLLGICRKLHPQLSRKINETSGSGSPGGIGYRTTGSVDYDESGCVVSSTTTECYGRTSSNEYKLEPHQLVRQVPDEVLYALVALKEINHKRSSTPQEDGSHLWSGHEEQYVKFESSKKKFEALRHSMTSDEAEALQVLSPEVLREMAPQLRPWITKNEHHAMGWVYPGKGQEKIVEFSNRRLSQLADAYGKLTSEESRRKFLEYVDASAKEIGGQVGMIMFPSTELTDAEGKVTCLPSSELIQYVHNARSMEQSIARMETMLNEGGQCERFDKAMELFARKIDGGTQDPLWKGYREAQQELRVAKAALKQFPDNPLAEARMLTAKATLLERTPAFMEHMLGTPEDKAAGVSAQPGYVMKAMETYARRTSEIAQSTAQIETSQLKEQYFEQMKPRLEALSERLAQSTLHIQTMLIDGKNGDTALLAAMELLTAERDYQEKRKTLAEEVLARQHYLETPLPSLHISDVEKAEEAMARINPFANLELQRAAAFVAPFETANGQDSRHAYQRRMAQPYASNRNVILQFGKGVVSEAHGRRMEQDFQEAGLSAQYYPQSGSLKLPRTQLITYLTSRGEFTGQEKDILHVALPSSKRIKITEHIPPVEITLEKPLPLLDGKKYRVPVLTLDKGEVRQIKGRSATEAQPEIESPVGSLWQEIRQHKEQGTTKNQLADIEPLLPNARSSVQVRFDGLKFKVTIDTAEEGVTLESPKTPVAVMLPITSPTATPLGGGK